MAIKRGSAAEPEEAAGNGLIDRRVLLAAAAGGAAGLINSPAMAAAELKVEPWMSEYGSGFVGYGQPSKFEIKVARTFAFPRNRPAQGPASERQHTDCDPAPADRLGAFGP
jgi:sulfane dehydrogenase subunit SoxC